MTDETRDQLGAWVRDCGGYFMRSAQGETGKLVRLDRVRRWLMAGDDGLPYEQAGEALLAPLEALTHAEIGEWLYLADEGKHARLVNGSDQFAWSLIVDLDYKPKLADCGVRGALHYARSYWCESPGSSEWFGQEAIEPLAVPVAKAHELWGWGGIAMQASVFPLRDWQALAAYRVANPGSSWADGNQLQLGRAEFERRGGGAAGKKSATLTAMASELGISRNALNDALFGYRKRPAFESQVSPLPSADMPPRRIA